MAKYILPNSQRNRTQHDINSDIKKETVGVPSSTQEYIDVKCGRKYCPKTNPDLNTRRLLDATTQICVSTDNVYVTTEIYSTTELPPRENVQQKPGTIVPEYYDGKCVILLAYRSKGVTTEDSLSFTEPCLTLECIFPPSGIFDRHRFVKRIDRSDGDREKKTEGVQTSRRTVQFEPMELVEVSSDQSICKETCPNLILNRTPETDGPLTSRAVKPEAQVDNGRATESMMEAVTVRETDEDTIRTRGTAFSMVDLTSIEEVEEPDEEAEQTVEISLSMERHNTETDVSESMTSVSIENADSRKPSTTSQHEDKEKELIEEEIVEQLTTDERSTKITDKTRDVAVGESVIMSAASSREPRRPLVYKFDSGTTISSESVCWIERVRRRRHCREISPRLNENLCPECRTTDVVAIGCRRIVQPSMSNRVAQCEIIRNDERSICSMNERTICGGPVERGNLYDRCFDRPCDETSNCREPNEFRSTDYWSSKCNPVIGRFQEPFSPHQFCRINTQRYSTAGDAVESCENRSIRNNACDRYYLNFSNTDNAVGRHCWCNSGYNGRNTNMLYWAASNQMSYHVPHRYHYFFNTWF